MKLGDGPSPIFKPLANDTITLQEKPEAAGITGNIDHFGFRLSARSQLERAIEEVIAAGGALVARGDHAPGRPYAHVTDPDGHVIEFPNHPRRTL